MSLCWSEGGDDDIAVNAEGSREVCSKRRLNVCTRAPGKHHRPCCLFQIKLRTIITLADRLVLRKCLVH